MRPTPLKALERFVAAAMILALALAVPGCGGSRDAEPPDRRPTAASDPRSASDPSLEAPALKARARRPMWVWNAESVVRDNAATAELLAATREAGISDLYLFLRAPEYVAWARRLKAFNARAHAAGVNVWGLEGWRGYFSDAYGPAKLYAAADALVAFNATAGSGERFFGFHSDLEPHDGQAEGRPLFHNGLSDSQLTRAQAAERNGLMRDWLRLHKTLSAKMRNAGLPYSAAVPAWLDDYYGEPVHVAFDGQSVEVLRALMPLTDEYVVLSYNTNPSRAVERAVGELRVADALAPSARPLVLAAVETHPGPGRAVSYGDHPTKSSKRAVLADMAEIAETLSTHTAFAGVSVHDWIGWRRLK